MPALMMPTEEERTAFRLREKQGLSDAEIGRVVGCTRETACRRRQRYQAKLDRLRLAVARGDGTLEGLLG